MYMYTCIYILFFKLSFVCIHVYVCMYIYIFVSMYIYIYIYIERERDLFIDQNYFTLHVLFK